MGKLPRPLPLNRIFRGRRSLRLAWRCRWHSDRAGPCRRTGSPSTARSPNFYRSRGGAPLWLAPRAGAAAQQLIQLLATAQADHLNPRRYNVRALERARSRTRERQSGGDPARRSDAERGVRHLCPRPEARSRRRASSMSIQELRPTPPSASELLNAAAHAPSLSDYVQQMGWMNPIYAKLRQAIASRLYANAANTGCCR